MHGIQFPNPHPLLWCAPGHIYSKAGCMQYHLVCSHDSLLALWMAHLSCSVEEMLRNQTPHLISGRAQRKALDIQRPKWTKKQRVIHQRISSPCTDILCMSYKLHDDSISYLTLLIIIYALLIILEYTAVAYFSIFLWQCVTSCIFQTHYCYTHRTNTFQLFGQGRMRTARQQRRQCYNCITLPVINPAAWNYST